MTDSTSTLYVRNWKPNSIIIKYAGQRFNLERRGSREDTMALPNEARKDKVVARWLANNTLEEIDQDDFIELATRLIDGPTAKLKTNTAREVNIPIEGRDSSTPTVVADDLFDKAAKRAEYMSPTLEYETKPLTTKAELAKGKKKTTRKKKSDE